MRKIQVLQVALLLLASLMRVVVQAQPEDALLKELANANQQTIEALVLYPEDTRMAILEVTKYPSLLIQMAEMKEKTSLAFQTLIEDFEKEDQAVFYELNRYPNLVDQLVRKEHSTVELQTFLELLPLHDQTRALTLLQTNGSTLIKIHQLSRTAQIAFSKQLIEYPARTQLAFSLLIQHPEVLELLNQDLRFTILVGDLYKRDSFRILHSMDSLHAIVARVHAEDLTDWKSTIENNQQAATELQMASDEYSLEVCSHEFNTIADSWPGNDPIWNGQLLISPYLYWFGSPWWEPYPRWYPYPYWWSWGGYYIRGSWVIIFLPSYHFMHWYFDRANHHLHYSHLSEQFVRHYQHHRQSGTTITMEVKNWKERHREILSDEYLKGDEGLRKRLITYADFEMKRSQYNLKNASRALDQVQFLEKDSQKYPTLKQARVESLREMESLKRKESTKRKEWAPSKDPFSTNTIPGKTTKPNRKSTSSPQTVQPTLPSHPSKTNEARDYHFQKWEESKPAHPTLKQPPSSKTTIPKKRGG
jgi:hypothetical protein